MFEILCVAFERIDVQFSLIRKEADGENTSLSVYKTNIKHIAESEKGPHSSLCEVP